MNTVADRLRQLLGEAAPDCQGVTVEEVAAGVRRRHRRRIAAGSVTATAVVVAVVVSLVTLLPGSGGAERIGVAGQPGASPATRRVPWVGRTYHPPVRGAGGLIGPPPARTPCRVGQLRFRDIAPIVPGPAGSVSFGLAVTNVGTDACELFVTGDQLPAQVTNQAGRPVAYATPNDLVAVPPPPGLRPGATATTTITWLSWCGSSVRGWRAQVQTSWSAYTTVPRPTGLGTPTCQHVIASDNATVGAPAWTVFNGFGQPLAAPVLALHARIDQHSLTAPEGGRVTYTVTLTNPTRGPIRLPLAPCPYYVSVISRGGQESSVGGSYQLNCPAMPATIPARTSLRLIMRSFIGPAGPGPSSPRPGSYALSWSVPNWRQLATTNVTLHIRANAS